MIRILVDGECKIYYVHKSLLLKIPWFSACLTHPVREALTGEVKLPEDPPRAFKEIVNYIYHERLSFDLDALCQLTVDLGEAEAWRTSARYEKFFLIIQVYALTKKLAMEELMNLTIDIIRKATDAQRFTNHHHLYLEAHLEEGDKLRALSLYCEAWYITIDGYPVWADGSKCRRWAAADTTTSMQMVLAAVTENLRKLRSTGKLRRPADEKFSCRWHTHVETEACPRHVLPLPQTTRARREPPAIASVP